MMVLVVVTRRKHNSVNKYCDHSSLYDKVLGASKEYERCVHLEKNCKTKDSFEIDIEATRDKPYHIKLNN